MVRLVGVKTQLFGSRKRGQAKNLFLSMFGRAVPHEPQVVNFSLYSRYLPICAT